MTVLQAQVSTHPDKVFFLSFLLTSTNFLLIAGSNVRFLASPQKSHGPPLKLRIDLRIFLAIVPSSWSEVNYKNA